MRRGSNLRGRLRWFQERHGQLCVWNKEHLVGFSVFSAVVGVFDGLVSAFVRMHRKWAVSGQDLSYRSGGFRVS